MSDEEKRRTLKQDLKRKHEYKSERITMITNFMNSWNFAIIATHRYPIADRTGKLDVDNRKQRKLLMRDVDELIRHHMVLGLTVELRVDYMLDGKLKGEDVLLIPKIPFGDAFNMGVTHRQRTIIYKDEKGCREIWTDRADDVLVEGVPATVGPGEVLRYYDNDPSDFKDVVKMLVDKTKSSEEYMDKYGKRVTDVRVGVKELVKPICGEPFYSVRDIYRSKEGFDTSTIDRNARNNK